MYPFPLVEVVREDFDDLPWFGFLVGESDALVMLHKISDRYDLDGYIVFRREHITSMSADFERLDLIRRVIRLKQLQPVAPEGLDLSSMRALMLSVQDAYGALVISQEDLYGDVDIGSIRMATDESFVLRWLSPEAEWENDDQRYRYRDVTLIEFAAEYENTLLQVALDRLVEREGF